MPDAIDPDFAEWLREVNAHLTKHFGLTLDDLPDILTRDAFDNEQSPWDFFDNEVKDLMIEEFGEDVALEWPSAPTDRSQPVLSSFTL
jgi:hypothetical protein